MMSNAFTDKTSHPLVPEHPFYQVSLRLAYYGGADILPYTDNNDLLTDLARQRAKRYYQHLLQESHIPDACVLLAITDEPEPQILLTQRASTLSSHAGEVSLVGGKRDDTDKSSLAVALREASEEVGLSCDDVTPIGYLPMQLSKNALLVRPVVALIHPACMPRLHANQSEIARLFWLPLSHITDHAPCDHVLPYDECLGAPKSLHTPAWLCDADDVKSPLVIWGLTARILANFVALAFGRHYEWYYRLV